jgi:hypothetical protein
MGENARRSGGFGRLFSAGILCGLCAGRRSEAETGSHLTLKNATKRQKHAKFGLGVSGTAHAGGDQRRGMGPGVERVARWMSPLRCVIHGLVRAWTAPVDMTREWGRGAVQRVAMGGSCTRPSIRQEAAWRHHGARTGAVVRRADDSLGASDGPGSAMRRGRSAPTLDGIVRDNRRGRAGRPGRQTLRLAPLAQGRLWSTPTNATVVGWQWVVARVLGLGRDKLGDPTTGGSGRDDEGGRWCGR